MMTVQHLEFIFWAYKYYVIHLKELDVFINIIIRYYIIS